MKDLKKILCERYDNKFSIQSLVMEGVPKLYLKIEAVKNEIERLEKERKDKFAGDYARRVNAETDPKKKDKLLQPVRAITKKIKQRQKNLLQLLDMEEKYIAQMGVNTELDISGRFSMYEDVTIGHENEPSMLRSDLSVIERYAEELGQLMAEFEKSTEKVDFPHWWQAKIIKAKDYIVAAKHYLRAELEKQQ